MKQKMYSVFDHVAKTYNRPMFLSSNGVAIREFKDECNRPDSPINKHPEDYELFGIGEYDDETGAVVSTTPKRS